MKKRATITAPKVNEGEKEFTIISEYWFTTFRELNPFVSVTRCHKCALPTVFERYVGDLHGGAVSMHEFACVAGHVWEYRKTND